MEDWPGFCRYRLRSCLLRRKKYPAGLDDHAHCMKDARVFLHAYRPAVIPRVLEIAQSSVANADEMRDDAAAVLEA